MALLKVTGIVMRYANYKDYDRMITLFTLERGKLSALARGARRPKSALVNGTEQFCMAEYVLFQSKDRYTITSCNILDSFYDIRSNIDSYYSASYFSSVCQTIVQEEQPDEKTYEIFAKLLAYLSHSESNALTNLIVGLCVLLDISGFKPELQYCEKCKEKLDPKDAYYDRYTGNIFCGTCKKHTDRKLSSSCIKALEYIFFNKENAFSKIKMEDWLIKEMITFLTDYLEIKLEKELKQKNLLLSII